MSHYTKIKTRIVERDFLIKALAVHGFTNVEVNQQPQNLYGYQGDMRAEKAEVIIRRQHISTASNDIGFALGKDGSYTMIVSGFDKEKYGPLWLDELTKTYAKLVVLDKFQAQGFSVSKEEATADKGMRLVLVRE